MAVTIKLRRGTTSEWSSYNPVLAEGEVGIDLTLDKFKIGDGTTAWNSLGYAAATVAELDLKAPLASPALTGVPTAPTASADTNTTQIATTQYVVGQGYLKSNQSITVSGDASGSGTTSINLTLANSGVSASTYGSSSQIPILAVDAKGRITSASVASVEGLPNQSGNNGKYLTTNGSVASWDTIDLGTDTQGNYVATISGTANQISVSGSGSETAAVTLSLPSTINVNTSGNAATATQLANSRTIALSGDVSGSVTFDGSASVNIATTIQPDSVVLGTDTTGNYVATASAGAGISISGSGSENAAITISNTGVRSLAGTANQISVSASNGDTILSLPSAVTFPGTVTLNADPGQPLEAATKQYVDAVAQGLHVHASTQTATTENINISNPPASIDGVTLTNGMRILVKNQNTTSQNGIYVVNGGNLNRATDFDTPAEIHGGDFVFVTGGTVNNDTGWVQTEVITTVGTDPIIFQQFSGAGTYLAGTGLLLTGNTFSNTGVLSLAGTANQVSVSASNGNITVSLPSSINVNTTGSAATLTTSRTIELSGDVSGSATFNGSANASITSTLANTAVTPATYGSASAVGTVTVDSKGRITGASNTAIAIAQSAVTNLTSDLALKANLASPALTGTPTAPTAAIDTNTTQIATTAYVVGQGYAKLASPALSGTPTAPTASVDTNTTQIATTAYVVGQGYLKSATASSTYAPLASPALTGTPTSTTAAVDTNTTQIATTAFVLGQASSTSPAMNGTAAVGTSTRYARADHVHASDTSRAPLASPTFTGTVSIPTLSLTQADTSTAATHYMVEIATDGLVRPKLLADVRTEIVTTAAVNAAAATTVGTITSGIWNGSIIDLARGGTNANLTAVNGGVVYSTATAFAVTSAGTAGQVLTSNGAGAPTWQAAAAGGSAVNEPFFLAGL